mmetsp:Transcript_19260/g.17083  ORF Transcript_19260/g.17083 Transcript_19260/m.17083 type:complete len:127 (+) Transcript_19260:352-732(+)
MHLKQIMEEDSHDRALESHQAYPIEIYSDRIPLYLKLQINLTKTPLNIYMRVNDEEDESDIDEEIKFDVRMFFSTTERKPSAKKCDYKCRGKYASIDLAKDLGNPTSEILNVAFTSKVGFKVFFAY